MNISSGATADSRWPVPVSPSIPLFIRSKTAIRLRLFNRTFLLLRWSKGTGAIAFFLAHEQEVDANIREGDERNSPRTVRPTGTRPPRKRGARSGEAVSVRFDFQPLTQPIDSLNDQAALRLAASQSRILLSHDRRTMPQTPASLSRRAAPSNPDLVRRQTRRVEEPDLEDSALMFSCCLLAEWLRSVKIGAARFHSTRPR